MNWEIQGERSDWIAAFERAGRASPRGRRLFAEWREDLRVVFDVPPGEFRVTGSRHSGLAVDEPDGVRPSYFLGSPSIEDVDRLGGQGDLDAISKPLNSPRRGRERPTGDPQRARSWLERLALAAVRQAPSVRLRASWVGFSQEVAVCRADRKVVQDRRTGSRARLELWRSVSGRDVVSVEEVILGAEELDADPAKIASRAIERNFERAATQPLPSGETVAVFAPGVGGALVHELVGHALEGDRWIAGLSWLSRSRGQAIAGEWVNVIDDPRRGRAAWREDDEGEPARATGLVRGGRVEGLILDGATAAHLDQRSTGHGRRSTFRDAIHPRMGGTFLSPGEWSPEEMLEGIEEGVYIRRLESASVDTISGRAVFHVIDADRIVAEHVTYPCPPFLICLDARSTLASLDRVANDLTFDVSASSCVRDGQPLAVSVGAPTFRVGLVRVVVPHSH